MATSQRRADPGESRVAGGNSGSEGAVSAEAQKRRLLTEAQEAEVREQRQSLHETRRVTAPGLEEILYEPLPVLDHGFVRVVDYMGDDGAIVQAARVSYGKGTKHLRGDTGLINYLLRHRHTTPFEMCEIKYHVKLPIFVARQWIRHRTANVNEYSARYSILDNEFYIPEPEHLAAQSAVNRQGRGAVLEGAVAERVFEILKADAQRSYGHYEEMLNERQDGTIIDEDRPGLARELARMDLPLNIYTQWYWKIDLHNLLHFLSLRADAHSQYEIRAYAEVMLDTVRRWVPATYEAFANYVMAGVNLSGQAMAVVRRLLAGEDVAQEGSGLSKREWRELMAVLGRDG
jgi:thymidylate synthase (FAD)